MHADRVAQQLGGGRGVAVGRGVNDGQRRIWADLFAQPAHLGQADFRIDQVGHALAPAAQTDHG